MAVLRFKTQIVIVPSSRGGLLMLDLPSGGSALQNPDLEWCQIRETILMLGIAVAQVRHAMHESSESFSTLATSFGNTFSHIEDLKTSLIQVKSSLPDALDFEAKIAEINEQSGKSITAFQFYDRLSQRLDHVCGTISMLASLVSDSSEIHQSDAWLALQQRIRSQYSMEQEKVLFDAILSGVPIATAIEQAASNLAATNSEAEDSDIEFF